MFQEVSREPREQARNDGGKWYNLNNFNVYININWFNELLPVHFKLQDAAL